MESYIPQLVFAPTRLSLTTHTTPQPLIQLSSNFRTIVNSYPSTYCPISIAFGPVLVSAKIEPLFNSFFAFSQVWAISQSILIQIASNLVYIHRHTPFSCLRTRQSRRRGSSSSGSDATETSAVPNGDVEAPVVTPSDTPVEDVESSSIPANKTVVQDDFNANIDPALLEEGTSNGTGLV